MFNKIKMNKEAIISGAITTGAIGLGGYILAKVFGKKGEEYVDELDAMSEDCELEDCDEVETEVLDEVEEDEA